MSWAAHDVEGWEKVERAGVKAKLLAIAKEYGIEGDSPDLDDVLSAIQSENRNMWAALIAHSTTEIIAAEADYRF